MYVWNTCHKHAKGQGGIWLVGLYSWCIRRAGNDAREKFEVWRRRRHRGLENNNEAYLAASFCSSARLFCSSWARWSSLSRARRASTSAARFASASLLGSKAATYSTTTVIWQCLQIYEVMYAVMFVLNLRHLWYMFCINGPMQILFLPQSKNDTTAEHAALVLVLEFSTECCWEARIQLTSVSRELLPPPFLFSPSLPSPVVGLPTDLL